MTKRTTDDVTSTGPAELAGSIKLAAPQQRVQASHLHEPTATSLTAFMPPVEAARRRVTGKNSRLLLYGISLTFFSLLLWAAFADIEETVLAYGQVVTTLKVQNIQNLEGGILDELFVKEGEEVEKGQILLRVENEQAGSVYRDSVNKSRELLAAIARLEAERTGNEPLYPQEIIEAAPELTQRHSQLLAAHREKTAGEVKTLEAQLDLKKMEEKELVARQKSLGKSLSIAEQQLAVAKQLMATRSYSRMEYLNQAQQVTQLRGELAVLDSSIPRTRAAVREAEEKIALHESERQARIIQNVNEARAELATLNEALTAGKDRMTRTEVASPVHGIVKSINISTRGGVIMPGDVIMEVVPSDEPLIIEARISPADRAFLATGQAARIRFDAYNFAIYGAVDATLADISADTIEGKQGEIFYRVTLSTKTSALTHNGVDYPILPGMTATADIITGNRTVLQYIVNPIIKAKHTAMRER